MKKMVNQKRKDQIGRHMLVDAIKQSGIPTTGKGKINLLTLPSSSCKDVLLLNQIFGKKNVHAVGYERNSKVFHEGLALAPDNLHYHFDSTGKKFILNAVDLAHLDLFNVIDFEFCGFYGSNNHVDVDTIIKVVAAKIALGKPAVIGATYSVSCSHHGNDKSVNALNLPPLENKMEKKENLSHPIQWWNEEMLGYDLDEQINGYKNVSAIQRYQKRKALALAQAVKIRLNQALFATFPPNKNFQVPFSVKTDCYGGGSDGGEIMLRIMIVVNSKEEWNELNASIGTFFPTSHFPTSKETKAKCLTNFIKFWTRKNHIDSLANVDIELYDFCSVLFGFSRNQVSSWHTTNMGRYKQRHGKPNPRNKRS